MSDAPQPNVALSSSHHREVETVEMGLARLASEGDSEATRALLASVTPRVIAVVRVVLGKDHPDCEDAVQQALIGFVQALSAFRGECSPQRFAAKIAVRKAVSLRRRARANRDLVDDTVEVDEIRTHRSPSAVSLAERRTELLRQLLGQLPQEQAEALAMRVVLGWTLEEVSEAAGVPQNTVRSRVRLAKEALRRKIEADPILHETLGVDR